MFEFKSWFEYRALCNNVPFFCTLADFEKSSELNYLYGEI